MGTRIKKLPKERAALFETSVHRRLALKLMAGTAATTTLAACGVNSAPTPQPHVRTNTVVLRGRLQDLSGRNLERLRAIAAFLDPVNRSRVDILGEYWAVNELLVQGKPGGDFIGDGIDMVVIAKGESAAAVREWAAQWAGVLDFGADEAEAIDPADPTRAVAQDAGPTFLVFERRAGAVAPKTVLEADPGGVYVVSHHVLVNDRRRQVLVVRAPSREAVRGWVERWGHRRAVEVLELTHLSEQLRICARSAICSAETATLAAAPLAASMTQGRVEVADYHPKGLLWGSDPKLGTFYLRHQATGRFLSIDGGGNVVTVASPSTGDRWDFRTAEGLNTGNYHLLHDGTDRFLNGDTQGHVTSSPTPQTWASGTAADQTYGLRKDGEFKDQAVLTADGQGRVSTTTPQGHGPDVNWEQWSDYNHPSALEGTLHDLVATTAHGAPWPEDAYTGGLKAAYDDLVSRLPGKQPPKSGAINSSDLENARSAVQGPGGAWPNADYLTVYGHLQEELSHFAVLNTWYGDSGHVQTLLNETTLNNLILIDKVQNLAHPAAGLNVKFGVGAFISFLAIAIAAAGAALPGGAVLGAVLAGAWRLYSSASSGAKDTLNTTVANLDADLGTTFNDLITRREDTRSAIAGDWGKLSFFAGMVADGTLTWPADTAKLRAVAARQFEISTWQSVTNGAWIISGVGWEDEDSGKPNAAGDLNSPWLLILQYRIRFIPRKAVVPGWVTDECYIPSGSAPPDSVAQHLFDDPNNTNPTYPADRNLGISMLDFFTGRNGWAIPPDPG